MKLLTYTLFLSLGLTLTACKNGGQFNLEPGARKVRSKGVPSIQVNLGGKAMIVESGKTPTTGVHGWVTVQPVTARDVSSASGTTLKVNRARKPE